MTTPPDELRTAAAEMRHWPGRAAEPLAKLLDEYADDWQQCPEDHPGHRLDEAALTLARIINIGGKRQ